MNNAKTKKQGITVLRPPVKMNRQTQDAFLSNIADDFDMLKIADFKWDEVGDALKVLNTETVKIGLECIAFLGADFVKPNLSEKEYRNLGRVARCFSRDFASYMNTLDEINTLYKDRTGVINNMEEYTEYNKISLMMQEAHQEWLSLCLPSISSIGDLVSLAEERQKELARNEAVV